ncbi:hypothetical protein CBR_g26242 [Chara braunii]|uniref:Glycosyltransferase 2-like domain-containing protein n=1 Tax=Chara braunii TaxID=69332 RepID=A0A388L7C5_CHABU|nr:hypothetical protein CBR_g26242 [Chara braunii]|eukprot:GBG78209.1 hypothetical protein CBR_g26242 [Chara braunii]
MAAGLGPRCLAFVGGSGQLATCHSQDQRPYHDSSVLIRGRQRITSGISTSSPDVCSDCHRSIATWTRSPHSQYSTWRYPDGRRRGRVGGGRVRGGAVRSVGASEIRLLRLRRRDEREGGGGGGAGGGGGGGGGREGRAGGGRERESRGLGATPTPTRCMRRSGGGAIALGALLRPDGPAMMTKGPDSCHVATVTTSGWTGSRRRMRHVPSLASAVGSAQGRYSVASASARLHGISSSDERSGPSSYNATMVRPPRTEEADCRDLIVGHLLATWQAVAAAAEAFVDTLQTSSRIQMTSTAHPSRSGSPSPPPPPPPPPSLPSSSPSSSSSSFIRSASSLFLLRCASLSSSSSSSSAAAAGGAGGASGGNAIPGGVGILTKLVPSFILSAFAAYPATWTSSLVVCATIFLLGSPVLLSGLSVSGLVTAFQLGTVVWRAFGADGFLIVAMYFVVGTSVTKIRMKQKENEGIAEQKKGRRGAKSVVGSGVAGFACGLASIFQLGGGAAEYLWKLAFVASFCTKLSDTVSSEIGKAYGKTTYLVTTMSVVPRGTEGAVSVEGTAAGVAAAAVMSAAALAINQVNVQGALLCVLASQIANLFESYLGATLQGREGTEWMTNDLANVLNISLGAILAVTLRIVLGGVRMSMQIRRRSGGGEERARQSSRREKQKKRAKRFCGAGIAGLVVASVHSSLAEAGVTAGTPLHNRMSACSLASVQPLCSLYRHEGRSKPRSHDVACSAMSPSHGILRCDGRVALGLGPVFSGWRPLALRKGRSWTQWASTSHSLEGEERRHREEVEGHLSPPPIPGRAPTSPSAPFVSAAAKGDALRSQLRQSHLVSIVIPVYNEVGAIAILVERVAGVMRRCGWRYEIICVDDGSTDGSTRLLKAMAAERDDLLVVILRRNFGQTAAMTAGFDSAAGEFIVTLDGDLQNDADDIPRLLDCLLYGKREREDLSWDIGGEHTVMRDRMAAWGRRQEGGRSPVFVGTGTVREDGGYDLVCGWRRKRKDNAILRNLPSRIANRLIAAVTGVYLHDYGCSLKAYRASLISTIRLYGEMHRFIPALAAIEGAAITELEIRHHPRPFGKSKYGALTRTPRVLLDLVTVLFLSKFRDRPIQFLGLIGLFFMCAASICGASGIVTMLRNARIWGLTLAWSSAVPTMVLGLELFLGGLQMVLLGLVAEISVRTYFESQARPVYRVREVASPSAPSASSLSSSPSSSLSSPPSSSLSSPPSSSLSSPPSSSLSPLPSSSLSTPPSSSSSSPPSSSLSSPPSSPPPPPPPPSSATR